MRQKKLFGLGTAVALLVVACGGGPTVEAASSPLGSSIAVHGDWTIEVYNEDGTLERRHEFSNALLESGRHILARLLTGNASASGDWTVYFGGPQDLCPSHDFAGQCTLTSSAEAVDTLGNASLWDGLVLSGSTTVEASGTITVVSTNPGICNANQAPDDCPIASATLPFTSRSLDEAVAVEAGQSVHVQVEISFTSG